MTDVTPVGAVELYFDRSPPYVTHISASTFHSLWISNNIKYSLQNCHCWKIEWSRNNCQAICLPGGNVDELKWHKYEGTPLIKIPKTHKIGGRSRRKTNGMQRECSLLMDAVFVVRFQVARGVSSWMDMPETSPHGRCLWGILAKCLNHHKWLLSRRSNGSA